MYDLGDNGWTRIFYHLAKTNKREKMFNVQGSHTFFLPVDALGSMLGPTQIFETIEPYPLAPKHVEQ